MEEDNLVLTLVQDAENLLGDIFLSGFHSVPAAVIERLQELTKDFESYGMKKGKELLERLSQDFVQRRGSFQYDVKQTAKDFCSLEFYLENARNALE